MKKNVALLIGIGIVIGLIHLTHNTVPRSVYAQSCTTPGPPGNVKVTFPDCNSTQCSFTQANCTWTAATGAANYQVKVTEIDTNTIVQNTTVASSVLKTTFPITSGKTYKCDITAVNSCGQTGTTGTDSLLCKVDGITSAPTATSAPLPTNPPPTKPPRPPLPAAGTQENMMAAGAITLFFVVIGLSLFVF